MTLIYTSLMNGISFTFLSAIHLVARDVISRLFKSQTAKKNITYFCKVVEAISNLKASTSIHLLPQPINFNPIGHQPIHPTIKFTPKQSALCASPSSHTTSAAVIASKPATSVAFGTRGICMLHRMIPWNAVSVGTVREEGEGLRFSKVREAWRRGWKVGLLGRGCYGGWDKRGREEGAWRIDVGCLVIVSAEH